MQFGRQSASAGQRNVARKRALLATAVALSVVCGATAQAQVEPLARRPAENDPRTLILTPSVGVQAAYTDNVRLTSTDRESDYWLRAMAGLDATVNGARTKAQLQLRAAYDFYADADDLNGWTGSGFGVGSYDLVQNVLAIEADASASIGSLTNANRGAIDRAGTNDRLLVTTAGIGPRLTTQVGLFDLDAAARVSYVAYDEADSSTVTGALPEDTALVSADVQLDSGNRLGRNQVNLLASYQEDDEDYRHYSAVASDYYRFTPNLRGIVRLGYDDIADRQNLVDINDPYWALGLEYSPRSNAVFSLEGGQRYGEASWAALAEVAVTDRLYISAAYTDTVEPDQGRIDGAFQAFVEQQSGVLTPLTPNAFTIDGNLYDATTRNKTARGSIAYVMPQSQIDLTGYWTDRYFYGSQASEKEYGVAGTYRRDLRPDLQLGLSADYSETYESVVYGEYRSLGLQALLTYTFTPTLQFNGGYAYRSDESEGADADIRENVVFVGLMKRF
jgi:uncharacterized protein (PEP-CTERM system associated)